jgi:hypothetical protein
MSCKAKKRARPTARRHRDHPRRGAEDIAALAAKLFVAGAFDLEEAARTSAASAFS